ncbi:cytochrome c oxidase subunit 6B1-like isoform X2 [Oppia nitens]|nr:cytochrome c oxidase subunit 6B1-like isoform X2 [Oppia nitens]
MGSKSGKENNKDMDQTSDVNKNKDKGKTTNGTKGLNPKMELKAVPFDPRFPNQNQTRNCYQNYLDYHRCLKVKNGDEDYCHWYKYVYTELCPRAWTDKWDDQRESGIFAGRI